MIPIASTVSNLIKLLDAYLGVPFVNRSTQQLSNFEKGEAIALKEIEALKERMKNNATPLAITEYTGEYTNQLYGKIMITNNGNQLNVSFKSHNNLTATIDYLDNNEWLLQYNNILYGIFPLKFKIKNMKVVSVDIKANDFIEYDPYTFIKK